MSTRRETPADLEAKDRFGVMIIQLKPAKKKPRKRDLRKKRIRFIVRF